ncbi:MAG: beta-glucosidase family protein [Promethearchaeota archaeon]
MNDITPKDDIMDLPFKDSSLDVEERVEDLLKRLTLEEKILLSSGKRLFFTKPIKRLGISSLKMTDGPHGVGSGIFYLKKMTYFPVAICRTATWNPELSEQFGVALAQEVRSVGRHIILAPGINIVRTPLCGRTFEYQTEDPYLNSVMAVAMVKGVQSQRIGACVKHYVANNQEFNRFKVSSEVSERALQEIYLPAFKATVKEADAWSFMACYNKVNGIHGCEHKLLIRDLLMKEWGFRGFVVSDWLATRFAKTIECANAGLSLEMPIAICYKKDKLMKAIEEKKISEEDFNDNIRRLLRVMFFVGLFDDETKIPIGSRNTIEHQALTRKIAEEGIVLLKNNNILPLNINKIKKIAIVGPNADAKMGFGGGSSMLRPKYEITPLKGIKKICKGKIKIISSPEKADIAIVITGLNHKKFMDRENKDRIILDLPNDQIELINETVKANPNTIVVLINGSPIAMDDWIENVPAVIEAWYAGMEAGNAIADILFGNINPSGKLPVTFPKKIADSPAHKSFRTYPGLKRWESIKEGDVVVKHKYIKINYDHEDKVYYDEDILVGYRYFDTKNIEPLFPFGHGLSYTTFDYSNLKIDKKKISGNEELKIMVDIKNTGNLDGAEVVQLYLQDVECSVKRPLKELKRFKKIFLKSGQKETILFSLKKEDLSFFDEQSKSWKAEKGLFKVLIGSSSRDIRLEGEFEYNN